MTGGDESLEDLYEHAPCGYLSAAADGTIVRVNETFLQWTGYRREELVGQRRFQDLLTPGGRIYHETHYAPLLRMQGMVREIALQIKAADGSRLPVLINSALHGEIVRTIVFSANDRKAYEDELLIARRREAEARERVERLQRLSASLAAAVDVADVAAAALDALIDFMPVRGGSVQTPDGDALCVRGSEDAERVERVALDGTAGPLGELRLHLERELSDTERTFLTASAGQCAQALERAHLYARTRTDAERAAFVAELARAFEESRSFNGRAERLVELLVPAVADHARVEVADGDAVEVVAERSVAAPGDAPSRAVELPLRAHDRPLGKLVVETTRSPDGALLADVAERAGLSLENARLYEHEHEVAAALQRSMITSRFPVDPRFLVAGHYQPSIETMEVGGDWYDAFTTGDGRLAVVVGDVVGRGIAAASAMGQLRSAVRALAAAVESPAELLRRLDDFVEHVEVARSATLVYADLDLETGTLRYACAGHPPPVLVSPEGVPELLWEGRSPPVGAAFGLPSLRTHADVELADGARLMLYTDGLVERRDRSIDAGLDALLAAVGERPGAPLAAVVAQLPEVLVQADAKRDDVCVLGLLYGSDRPFERRIDPDVAQLAPLRADLRAWLTARAVPDPHRSALVLACSEAVANAMEHGCGGIPDCCVEVVAEVEGARAGITVRDTGAWREPNLRGNRGRGLRIIGHLMDAVDVTRDGGTVVRMHRALGAAA